MLDLFVSQCLLLPSGGNAAPAFSPGDLDGLTLWLDARAPNSLWQNTAETTPAVANDDPVRRWKDRSLNARHFDAPSDAARPLLVGASHLLSFDGNKNLTNAATSYFLNGRAHAFFALTPTTYSDNRKIAEMSNGNWMVETTSAPGFKAYNNDGAIDNVTIGATNGQTYILQIRHQGGTLYISKNGGAETSVASGNTLTAAAIFLGGTTAHTKFAGTMGEVILGNSAGFTDWNADVRNQIGRYLANKWGASWTNQS